MLSELLGLGYPILLVAGLVAAIVRRNRLGPAAGVAIAGFAVLALSFVASELYVAAVAEPSQGVDFENRVPTLGDIPAHLLVGDLMLVLANMAGTALLIAAVVRRESKTAQP